MTPEQVRYAANDVIYLETINKLQCEKLAESELMQTAELEFSIVPAVAEMELKGIRLDTNKIEALKKDLLGKQNIVETKLRAIVRDADIDCPHETINFNSPAQVKNVFHHLGFKVSTTKEEMLQKIEHPFAKVMLEHRKNSTLISRFANKLPEHINQRTARIHAQFNQMGTATGRFSCNDPNLQTIPKDQGWRDLFAAPPGYKIITADYSQIELRIAADWSQDRAMVKALSEGCDLHAITASELFSIPIDTVTSEQRNIAKTINFGIPYGSSPAGLSETLGIPLSEAIRLIKSHKERFPQLNKFFSKCAGMPFSCGHSITYLGRKRYFEKPKGQSEFYRQQRESCNAPIQGTSADILKRALYHLWHALNGHDATIVHVVHDEIVVECKENQADTVQNLVRENMIRAGRDFLDSVPVEVEITVDDVWRK